MNFRKNEPNSEHDYWGQGDPAEGAWFRLQEGRLQILNTHDLRAHSHCSGPEGAGSITIIVIQPLFLPSGSQRRRVSKTSTLFLASSGSHPFSLVP